MPTFHRSTELECSAAAAMAWHQRPGALQRLCPPWERVEVLHNAGTGIADGTRVNLRQHWGPLAFDWEVEHWGFEPDRRFCDRQLQGPFARWEHEHRFEPLGEGRCRLVDTIQYELPTKILRSWSPSFLQERLERLFAYRHRVTQADLKLTPPPPGRVVISGASGLLGRSLVPLLQTQGWAVDRLVRRPVQHDREIYWDPHRGTVEWPEDYRCDAVIHLAGANIADGRWTPRRREAILGSRIEGTRTLVGGLDRLAVAPRVFVSGSAVGYYGATATGESVMTEESPAGRGFLAQVCHEWEGEAAVARQLGIRTVMLRTGAVLSPAGGALAKMLPAFQAGLGGRLGTGQQPFAWIGIEDWVQAVRHVLASPDVDGPVNVTAPQILTQAEFAATMAAVLRRPALLPVPAFTLKLLFGRMAEEVLLTGAAVEPRRLTETGFRFQHPTAEAALRHVLGRPAPGRP